MKSENGVRVESSSMSLCLWSISHRGKLYGEGTRKVSTIWEFKMGRVKEKSFRGWKKKEIWGEGDFLDFS